MVGGAFVLAITAVFATKANKKFAPLQTGYGTSNTFAVVFPSAILTATSTGNSPAFITIKTSGGFSFRTQLRTHSGSVLLYY